VVRVPYGSARYEAKVEPDDATTTRVTWTVTEPDGSPTQKAEIDADGVLTVNHREGAVVVTATATDGSGVSGTRTVVLDLDPSLYRDNAARWPGVTATASSQYNDDHGPAKVHDGFGAGSGEWASRGEQNPWIQLTWDRPIQADRIVLYDRPGIDDV